MRRGAALYLLVICLPPTCAWKCPWWTVAAQGRVAQTTPFLAGTTCMVLNILSVLLTDGLCIGSSLAARSVALLWRWKEAPSAFRGTSEAARERSLRIPALANPWHCAFRQSPE